MTDVSIRSLLLLTALAILPPSHATAQTTFSATLTLAALPTTITLCRDGTAIQTFGTDEQWSVSIDIDANPNTGDATGVDVVLLAATLPQSFSCSPTVVNTSDALISLLLKWDAGQQNYVDTGATPLLALDFSAHTMTFTTEVSGDLANLAGNSHLVGHAGATYTATGTGATAAYDTTGTTTPGASTSDPSGDVQSCTAPCSAGASYYSMIDIIGMNSTANLDAFGANTLTVEFDLASLPANLTLCAYPGLFTEFGGVEYGWVANVDVDNNPNTGSYGFDVIIEALSTPQEQGCSTNMVPIAQGISAILGQWDDVQQTYVPVADLPVTINVAAGKIFVQADRSLAALFGLSARSPMLDFTAGLYSDSETDPYTQDIGPAYSLGTPFVDPTGDMLYCFLPCAANASWYPQIDLVGGSTHLPDSIFHGGFE